MFADKYDDLYTSVPYDNTEMDVTVKHINSGLVLWNLTTIVSVSYTHLTLPTIYSV